MISTKGRYAIRIMLDLAEHSNGSYIPMKDVAKRQDISLKYIEQIMPSLTKANLVTGLHGRGGGYKLAKEPADYNIREILVAAGENLSPVACLSYGSPPCPRAAICKTLSMWREYGDMTDRFFSSVTLADVMKTEVETDYII